MQTRFFSISGLEAAREIIENGLEIARVKIALYIQKRFIGNPSTCQSPQSNDLPIIAT